MISPACLLAALVMVAISILYRPPSMDTNLIFDDGRNHLKISTSML